jgi:hypothetical protein
MPDRLLNDIVTLLIPTLFLAFAWWTDRLSEVKYEKNLDRLPKWMQVWSNLLGMLSEPPKKTARWTFAGLLLMEFILSPSMLRHS